MICSVDLSDYEFALVVVEGNVRRDVSKVKGCQDRHGAEAPNNRPGAYFVPNEKLHLDLGQWI